MLLRSSSTPVIGSIIPSFSDTPNNNKNPHHSGLYNTPPKHPSSSSHQNSTKLLCKTRNKKSKKFTKTLPASLEIKNMNTTSHNVLRRAQSEGSLKKIANGDNFTYFNDEEKTDEELEEEEEENVNSFKMENFVFEEMRRNLSDFKKMEFESEGKLYLATGFGMDLSFVDGGRGGGSYRPVTFYQDGGNNRGLNMEKQYKKMLEGDPGNPLFLRNFAQFLYQIKGDVKAAEEFYARAVLADPEDSEILSQYAKLIWKVHKDRERAAIYFERSVQASSDENSHVHAAYARFLWNIEDDEEEETGLPQRIFQNGIMASVVG